jgi:phosphatidylinositol phospholipase C beta
MAFVRFGVYEENGRLLGQNILPVSYIQPGYKHIALRNNFCRPLGPVSLFIHVDVFDYVSDCHRELVRDFMFAIKTSHYLRSTLFKTQLKPTQK